MQLLLECDQTVATFCTLQLFLTGFKKEVFINLKNTNILAETPAFGQKKFAQRMFFNYTSKRYFNK